MKKILKQRKAQSTLEFAVLIVCIVGAVVAMQAYVVRSMQGRHRASADNVGEQYDPRDTDSDTFDAFTTFSVTETETLEMDGATTTTTWSDMDETHDRVGRETVGPLP